ncbi:hypothetical protein VTL71DRAFT_7925 [Oculimacula yallundae]|uniref:mannan endo-1,6-alpha-mannosidase n=1 Tax=Oculimacula yallundae TaxID=86028 RepID=A0ABR4CX35_9HELO
MHFSKLLLTAGWMADAIASPASTESSHALTSIFSKLTEYYHSSPNITAGLFDQTLSPWWESGSIFETYMDYEKYTGSTKYQSLVGEALVLNSYGEVNDFFGTDHDYVSTVLGRWNDDVLWYALAAVSGAELYRPDSYMPGLSRTWVSLVQRTIDEVYEYWTSDCGGGIYWSTDSILHIPYKSGITQLEFISLVTRTYLLTENATLLRLSEEVLTWMVDSKLVNLESGTVNDGVETDACAVSEAQWSYSYGSLVGGLVRLYEATGNESYMSYASNVARTGIDKFAPNEVAEELCEASGGCNHDQQGFKTYQAIFLRQLANLYIATPDEVLRFHISNVIERSAEAALATCDESWNCSGDWVDPLAQWYPDFRSTHLVAAALVALEGIKER